MTVVSKAIEHGSRHLCVTEDTREFRLKLSGSVLMSSLPQKAYSYSVTKRLFFVGVSGDLMCR